MVVVVFRFRREQNLDEPGAAEQLLAGRSLVPIAIREDTSADGLVVVRYEGKRCTGNSRALLVDFQPYGC